MRCYGAYYVGIGGVLVGGNDWLEARLTPDDVARVASEAGVDGEAARFACNAVRLGLRVPGAQLCAPATLGSYVGGWWKRWCLLRYWRLAVGLVGVVGALQRSERSGSEPWHRLTVEALGRLVARNPGVVRSDETRSVELEVFLPMVAGSDAPSRSMLVTLCGREEAPLAELIHSHWAELVDAERILIMALEEMGRNVVVPPGFLRPADVIVGSLCLEEAGMDLKRRMRDELGREFGDTGIPQSVLEGDELLCRAVERGGWPWSQGRPNVQYWVYAVYYATSQQEL